MTERGPPDCIGERHALAPALGRHPSTGDEILMRGLRGVRYWPEARRIGEGGHDIPGLAARLLGSRRAEREREFAHEQANGQLVTHRAAPRRRRAAAPR